MREKEHEQEDEIKRLEQLFASRLETLRTTGSSEDSDLESKSPGREGERGARVVAAASEVFKRIEMLEKQHDDAQREWEVVRSKLQRERDDALEFARTGQMESRKQLDDANAVAQVEVQRLRSRVGDLEKDMELEKQRQATLQS